MNSQISVFQYQTKSGKMWGFRFETASIGGKRKWYSQRGFYTKTEAAKHGRDAQIQYENKRQIVSPSEMSYSDFLDAWLGSLVGILKETTIENYTKKAKLYLKPYLGGRKLNSITKDDIRELMLMLQANGCCKSDAGLAQNTLSIIKGMIQKSFAFAVDSHMLTESPVTGRFPVPVAKPYSASNAERTKPHVYIPQFRIEEIFDRFPEGTTDHIAMMFGYKCGLRIGEAFAVTWEDIDFDKNILHVRRQVQWKQNKNISQDGQESLPRRLPRHNERKSGFWYFSNPKYDSKRDVYLDNDFVELLVREKKRQERDVAYYGEQYFRYYEDNTGKISVHGREDQEPIHFVSVRRDGEYITPRTMQHTSRVIHHAMNYKEFDFHSLRHTHATMLVENGASPMYVQHRLGHKSLEITMRVYFHYTDKMEESGVEVLSKIFNIKDEC